MAKIFQGKKPETEPLTVSDDETETMAIDREVAALAVKLRGIGCNWLRRTEGGWVLDEPSAHLESGQIFRRLARGFGRQALCNDQGIARTAAAYQKRCEAISQACGLLAVGVLTFEQAREEVNKVIERTSLDFKTSLTEAE